MIKDRFKNINCCWKETTNKKNKYYVLYSNGVLKSVNYVTYQKVLESFKNTREPE